MFRSKDDKESSISGLVEKKTRMFKSKVDYFLRGDHKHYFSKKETLDPSCNPACKVCGLLLSDYKIQKKFEKLNEITKDKKGN